METYIENTFKNMNYCFKTCYETKNLSLYKECITKCESFRNKKLEFINNYLDQIDSLITGKETNNKEFENVKFLNNQVSKPNYLIDKYIFKDYYYQSNEHHDVGVPSPKASVGSLFGRNK